MADAYLLERTRIILEDASGVILAENGDTFLMEGTVAVATDRLLMEDGLGVYLLDVSAIAAPPGGGMLGILP